MKIEILQASRKEMEDLKELAELYNISIGKVKLITHVLAIDFELAFEEAAEMPIRELNKIICADRDEVCEFYSENIRNAYQDAKKELQVELILSIKGLINEYIQSASTEGLSEILNVNDVIIEEVKALHQEYYDALVNRSVEEKIEEDEQEKI